MLSELAGFRWLHGTHLEVIAHSDDGRPVERRGHRFYDVGVASRSRSAPR
jgi:hypothetical protein